jgi:hypothetical protein
MKGAIRQHWLGYAGVVELVDAPDSKSGSVRSVGSIPTARTTYPNPGKIAATLSNRSSDAVRSLPNLLCQGD